MSDSIKIKNVVLHYVFYLRKSNTEFAPGVLVLIIIIKFNESMLTIMTKQKQ